jgi:cobalt-zinc-cadmium resistance protein CzcA
LGLGFTIMNENGHLVTERLAQKLAGVRKNLPPDVQIVPVYQRTELVDQVIDTVRKNLFEGGLLVVAVLFIFLGNLRAGLVVALAIPLSMLFAFSGMLRFGIAASLLSLGALDFGLLVDSSVIMVENIVRRLGHPADSGKSRLELIRDAAVEVRQPTMFGELIIMIVYLPILTLEGVEGKLYRPMALTVIFALIGSLVLSLTVMPC